MDILIILGILLLVLGGIGYNIDKYGFFCIGSFMLMIVIILFGITLLVTHGISFPVWAILLLIVVLCIGA